MTERVRTPVLEMTYDESGPAADARRLKVVRELAGR